MYFAHFRAVDRPRDIAGCPLDLIGVPVVSWVKVFNLPGIHLSSRVDNVCMERMLFKRRDQLDVDLVPAPFGPGKSIRFLPVREESADCALLPRALHPGPELAILEPFLGLDLSTDVASVVCGSSGGQNCG